MANISLTKENIKYIRDAFWHFFPEDTIYSADKPYVSGEFNWENRRSFIDFVYRLTGVQIKSEKDFQNIKKAELTVEGLVETGEEKPASNTLTPDQLKQFEKEEESRKAELKETQAQAKKNVEEAIKRKEVLADKASQQQKWAKLQQEKAPVVASKDTQEKALQELKGKVIYAVPEQQPPQITLSKDEESLVKIAQTNPQVSADKLSKLIIEKNPDIPLETLQPLSQIVAVDATKSFIDPARRIVPTGVFSSISKVGKQIPGLSQVTQAELAKTSALLTVFSESQENLYRTLLVRSVGENLTNKALGFPETTYTLSETPKDGSFTLKLDQLQSNSFSLQESPIFGAINNPSFDFAKSTAKSQLTDFAASAFKTLPKEGFLGRASQFFSSKTFDSVAPFMGLPTQAIYTGTNFFGKAITTLLPNYAPLVANLAGKIGIDLGITAIAPVVATGVTETGSAILASGAAKTAVGGIVGKGLMAIATKVGLGSTITAIGQALGSFVPVVGNAIAFAATWLIGKIASKINWAKVKEWGAAIIGGVAGLIALPFLGIGSAIGIGLGATAVSAGLGAGLGGATLAGVGSGIAGFFGALGGAFLGAIGMPILVTLLVFPVLVALILFIINSGAYIVPPSTSTIAVANPYIGVEKVATPPGPLPNSINNVVKFTVTITAKLGTLSNITLIEKCNAISKNGPTGCPSVTLPTPPVTISPSTPYVFSYDVAYNSTSYNDSLITNTITVSATVDDGQQTASGGAGVIIGSPPTGCFQLDSSWNGYPNEKATELSVIAQLSQAQQYMVELCAGGNIKVTYKPDPSITYGGEIISGEITIYPLGVHLGSGGALHTTSHESGHIYAVRTGKYALYLDDKKAEAERPICTYITNPHKPSEDFAEMIGMYVAKITPAKNGDCITTTFKQQYLNHWNFARNNIFYNNLGW